MRWKAESFSGDYVEEEDADVVESIMGSDLRLSG